MYSYIYIYFVNIYLYIYLFIMTLKSRPWPFHFNMCNKCVTVPLLCHIRQISTKSSSMKTRRGLCVEKVFCGRIRTGGQNNYMFSHTEIPLKRILTNGDESDDHAMKYFAMAHRQKNVTGPQPLRRGRNES